ncbi:unnamed protein product [Hyaloperonospora brassicae]|uniref:Uncharacterized protein n=1 Tax=Hyaloperonospora brassicae TaxID=162125 RepID=A0AAV0TW50_HYABA|nr:unnamed protein product [Hyaloperonospora brassicae]
MSDASATSADSDIGRVSIGCAVANARDASEFCANEKESAVQASDDVVVPTRGNSGCVARKLIAPVGRATDEDIADGSHSNDATYVAEKVEEDTRVQNASASECHLVSSSSAGGLFGGDIRTLRDRNDLLPLTYSSVFEGHFADLEASFGSENGEIALLGSSEDAFDPVDELLPATHEGSDEWPDDFGPDALPEAMTKGALSSRCNAGVGARGDESFNGRPCYSMNEKVPNVDTVQADVISMLQVGGIVGYCEYKQTHVTPADKLSLAVYEVKEDDPDLVFQALVGDDPLSDDWFHDVSPSPSHLNAKKLDRCAGPRSTFDLIMNNASPEEILAAELSNEECGDFDLVVSFRYPVPERRGRTLGRRHSLFTCAPTARAHPSTGSKMPVALDENVIEGHDTPSSRQLGRVQQQIAMTPQDATSAGTSVLPPTESSLSQPQPMMQTVQSASAMSSAHATSGESIPRLKALASSASNVLPTARSFIQRRSFSVSTSGSSSRALGASGVTTNSVTSASKPAERSRLPLPQRSFGFRRPASGLTKRT